MGGRIGHGKCNKWKPFAQEIKKMDLEKLEMFRKTLPSKNSLSQNHKKELEFMAENGLRQVGVPKIGIFANLQQPEQMHNKVNAWQRLLNLMYKEALQRQCIESFLDVLSASVKVPD